MLGGSFFECLKYCFWFVPETLPVQGIFEEDEWLYLQLVDMQAPSKETWNVIRQGYLRFQGEKLYPGLWEGDAARPAFFYHGTDMQSLISVLRMRTLKPSSELGQPPHKPDGVYSFGLQERSEQSSYVSHGGVQIQFESPGLIMTMANSQRIGACPVGAILRTWRSSVKKFGARGREWIHNSNSIRITGIRVRKDVAAAWMKNMKKWFCQVRVVLIF